LRSASLLHHPATRRAASPGFVEFRAERHKWVHAETWKIFTEELPIDILQPAPDINQDWRWCWEHWPYLDDTEGPRRGIRVACRL
jgi:hypothetical protein